MSTSDRFDDDLAEEIRSKFARVPPLFICERSPVRGAAPRRECLGICSNPGREVERAGRFGPPFA
eukprot:953776-Lingulodinium_polyedra.AAC.1